MKASPRKYRLSTGRRKVPESVLVASAVLLAAKTCLGQEQEAPTPQRPVVNSPESYQLGHSPLNEPVAVAKADLTVPQHYFIPVGRGGINLAAGLKAEYVDNVYLTHRDTKDDFVIIPECDLAAFFPVGQLNVLAFDVGLAYYEYLKNSELNTGQPLINPNSALKFNLRSGDFTFGFSEAFSYQQDPIYESGSEYYNLYNIALFQRYLNRVGCLGKWDQQALVVSASYFHENLWSETSLYSYVDHASELFTADGMLATSPKLTVGLEAAGSINDFYNQSSYNTWRARVGPALRLTPNSFLRIRLGGGYEHIEYDSGEAESLGLKPDNTYYAYANVEHDINIFFRHSLTLSHDNQLGFNAANLEGSTLSYTLTWNARPRLSVSPLASISHYDESFGSTTAKLYHERFWHYFVGLRASYRLGEHWLASASYAYRLKDSEIESAGYMQNRAFLEIMYQF